MPYSAGSSQNFAFPPPTKAVTCYEAILHGSSTPTPKCCSWGLKMLKGPGTFLKQITLLQIMRCSSTRQLSYPLSRTHILPVWLPPPGFR